ncbi:uncharacterized protein A4U43_C01F29680 [Asparagus officinalis]|uniref:Uncharacterized protein n=1 Tax=Asparagus officinalis TaxID=4686 RepID=A0A5P1FWV3_ASPOF|nr:uncharacterized protein LOC109829143 [Asparagus officinalis]ONK81490.1 uncharacterized protein A4U43_C01F29680 [Asparagus officinalis]
MAMMSKTKDLFEGIMREGSFKWAISRRTSFDEEFEEMGRSPSGKRKSIPELSPIANVIVGRCSKILNVSTEELQRNFNLEASETIKIPSVYARNFLEYCCFRALAASTQVTGHLADLKFRRLTFDMMLAWEAPAASQASIKVDRDSTVGIEAFSRIAPAIPIIADVITCSNLFDVLTHSTGGRLSFTVYDKYLGGLDRSIKKMKTQTESSLLSAFRSHRGERILEMDGTLTTQPVLEHVGISTWPGRLTLTDHALYFEALKVVTYDKAKVYDLADDLKQVIRPELTGPWGSRLFDKAVMYKSTSLSEPVIMEFPELTGHSRRDYWLAIIREILYAHRFIRKFRIVGVEREETLSKAVLGILRLQAVQDLVSSLPVKCEALLMFNLSDELPGGDLILETLASMALSRGWDQTNNSNSRNGMHSISALTILSNLGVMSQGSDDGKLLVGEILVGEMTSLERVVNESRNNYKMVEKAQATVDGVKEDGLDTNLAVLKELLCPMVVLGKKLTFLASWEDPFKSFVFCSLSSFIIFRGWLGYVLAAALLFVAIFMLLTRYCNQGRPIDQVKVVAPPPMNTMEQLLAVQNAISQVEEFVQDANIVLLKIRALLLAAPSQATDRAILALVLLALITAFLPIKWLILLTFLETFTRYSPPRRLSTERWTRRMREWWFSIPAAPVVLNRESKEDKKRK